MIRKAVIVFSMIIGVLLALVVLAVIGIDLYFRTDRAQAMIREKVNAAIPGRIDWETSRLSLLAGRVSLGKAAMKGPDGETIISADEIDLDVSLAGLLYNTIVVENARLKSPLVQLAFDEKGNLNLYDVFWEPLPEGVTEPEYEWTFPFDVQVDNLDLTGGLFRFRVAPTTPGEVPQSILLEQIDVRIETADVFEPSGKLAAKIAGGAIALDGFDTVLQQFSLKAALRDGRLEPLALDLKTTGPNLTVTGAISRLLDKPNLDLDIDVAVDLSLFNKYFELELDLDGPVRLDVHATGDPNNPTVEADAHYGGGNFPTFSMKAIDVKARMEDWRIDVDHIVGHGAPGILTVTGKVDMKGVFDKGLFGDSSFDFETFGYDADINTRDFDMSKFPWTWDLLAGMVAGNIHIKGVGVYPTTMTTEATADLTGDNFGVKDAVPPVDIRVTTKAGMAGGRITADPLILEKEDSVFRVTGGYQLFANTMDAALKVNTPDLAQVLAPFGFPVVSGKSELVADVKGYVLNLAVDADLKSRNLRYEDISIGDLAIDARMDASGKVAVNSLSIANKGSVIRGKGTINLFKGSFEEVNYTLPADLTATFERVELADFTSAVPVGGNFSGELHLTKTIANPDADLTLSAGNIAYHETGYGDLTAHARLSDGIVNVDRLSLEKEQSKLNLTGAIDLAGKEIGSSEKRRFNLLAVGLSDNPTLDVRFTESLLHAEDFTDALSGKLAIDGRLRGPAGNIAADLTITGEKMASGEQGIGNLNARVVLENGTVRLDPVMIRNGKSDLALTGTIGLFKPDTLELAEAPALDLTIAGKSIRLKDFGDTFSGRLDMSGDIGGTLNDLRGSLSLDGEKIDLGVQKFDSIRVSGRLEGKRIHIDPAVLSLSPESLIRAEGWISLDTGYSVRITSDAVNLAGIGYLKEADLTGGTLALDLKGSGTFDDPELAGEFHFINLNFSNRPAPNVDIQLALENNQAVINAQNGFSLDARYHLDDWDFSVNADFNGTNLDPYFSIAGLPEIAGKLTGTLAASGNVTNLANARVNLSVSEMAIFRNRVPLIRTSGLKASLENRDYAITDTRFELLRSGRLDLGGSGRIPGNLNLHAEGAIPFEVISAFIESIDNPTGNIALSARLEGSVDDPDFQATLSLDRIGMIVPVLLQSLHDVSGRIRITDDALVIEDVTGGLDTGKLALDGRIDLSDLAPVGARLKFKARTVPIEIPDMLELIVNSELTLEGSPADSRLTGRITVLEGLYYKDFNLSLIGRISEIGKGIGKRQREIEPPAEMPVYETPFLKNLNFDVAVGYRSPILVDNNLALLSLKPALRVRGTLARPLLNGRAEVADGTITYRNTEFEVERGVVDFINPYRIVPTIDIIAETEVRTWDITLAVSGAPQNLDFKLSSDPTEADVDIASLLLTGKTTLELEEGTGGATASPEEMLANIVASRFEENIKETTGFDVEFEYQGEGAAAGTDTRTRITPNGKPLESPTRTGNGTDASTAADDTIKVTVGKELSRRLTIKYGMERKSGEVVHQQTAVYKLLENLSVNAFQDTEGIFGGELRFRLEFR